MTGIKAKRVLRLSAIYVLVAAILIPVLFPLYFVITSSLKNMADVYRLPPVLFGFQPIFDHYIYIFATQHYAVYIWNSLVIALSASSIALVLGLPAAYAIARYKMNRASAATLVVKLLPNISILLPYYIVFSRLGLVDTHVGLAIAHSVPAISTVAWIMISYFSEIPYELEEAAIVDGCTRQGVFMRIVLPISISGIVTCATMVFLYSWNNFQYSLILGGRNTQTLPVSLQYFVSGSGIKWGRMLAATVVVTVPTLLLTMLLQKYIVKGLTSGAVKG
jgi:multiple sugar transport system permease protein